MFWQPMPPAKSMYEVPSAPCSRAPSALVTTICGAVTLAAT
jgi:hypothetical protein